jgi:hypothetical protein
MLSGLARLLSFFGISQDIKKVREKKIAIKIDVLLNFIRFI